MAKFSSCLTTFLLIVFTLAGRLGAFPTVRLSKPFPKLSFKQPTFLTSASDQSGRLYVLEQAGKVLVFPNRPDAQASVFLDLSSKIRLSEEEGLLSLAFHPDYKRNHVFFAIYSLRDAEPHRTVLARFKAPDSGPVDLATEEDLLEVEKLYENHNGSTLAFGPDGFLYISLGDGGSGGDPHGNGQKLSTFLGKILRIDVDHAEAGKLYAVPKDNPFVIPPGTSFPLTGLVLPPRPEIWAYGLRNPWRMSFDSKTGDLWAGDVGQDKWEEVDLITKGGNYGWNLREGSHRFKGARKPGMIEPVLDYGRDKGFCVIGGGVYRGKTIPGLEGTYVFGDFGSRRIWGLQTPVSGKAHWSQLARCPQPISSFGRDEQGEIYVVGYLGALFKLEASKP
jgi:quinoprotein glucose dehydrogenase